MTCERRGVQANAAAADADDDADDDAAADAARGCPATAAPAQAPC